MLAAGPGRRLQELTRSLPKALLQIDARRTILDMALTNLRSAGIEHVYVVAGFAAERLAERVPELERRHGLRLHLLYNDRAEDMNNAYSLWLARDVFAEGALLVNGDTLHPAAVEERLLAGRGPELLIALDDQKQLADEEMKVLVTKDGLLRTIGKDLDPASAAGEYVGLALIEATGAAALAQALERTWKRDPALYYEDAFQEFVDAGGVVGTVPIGGVEWVEVDDAADLARAREIATRSY